MGKSSGGSLTLAALCEFQTKVAEASDSDAVFAIVASASDAFIGHRLFTVMAFDAPSMQVRRLYSSNPDVYPPGGSKHKRDTQWGRQVLEEGRPFVGRNAGDIRANFGDHEIILRLGLESVLNVPVRVHGRTIGTMNLLHRADYYDSADVQCAALLASQLAGSILLFGADREARGYSGPPRAANSPVDGKEGEDRR